MEIKNIKEIFETNPELLETKEVKELIEQFHFQFKKLKGLQFKNWDEITTLTMNSDLFVKDGMSCKEVVNKINEVLFK